MIYLIVHCFLNLLNLNFHLLDIAYNIHFDAH